MKGLDNEQCDRRPVAIVPDAGIRLSARQTQILQLLSDGVSTEDIAAQFGVSQETVRTHLKRLARRLGAQNRTHAVSIALRAGLIS